MITIDCVGFSKDIWVELSRLQKNKEISSRAQIPNLVIIAADSIKSRKKMIHFFNLNQSVYILAIRSNKQQETVWMTKYSLR